MRSLITLCGVLASLTAMTSSAPAEEMMLAQGVPTVDGVISPGEWDNAALLWHDLDQHYSGDPVDLSQAIAPPDPPATLSVSVHPVRVTYGSRSQT